MVNNLNPNLKHVSQRLLGRIGVGVVRTPDVERARACLAGLWPMEADLVRLGPRSDGGYLVPEDLDGIVAAFSPGVSDECGFELSLANLGIPVFMADHSVMAAPIEHDLFSFERSFIGGRRFGHTTTLDEWQHRCFSKSGDLLLQMDIEGSEFEAILSMSDSLLRRFRIVVVEFHMRSNWLNDPYFRIAETALGRLRQSHRPVHFHWNNCCGSVSLGGDEYPRVFEVTYHRKDRTLQSDLVKSLPHLLDADNTSNPPMHLDPLWRGRAESLRDSVRIDAASDSGVEFE